MRSQSFRGPRPSASAFSLPELLVTVVILGVLAIGLTNFLNAQLFQSVRYEKGSRETDDASRLQHLIETEVSESDQITYGDSLQAGCGSGKSLFSLRIPSDYDTSTGLPSYYTTNYYQVTAGVYRCGKPVNADGSLNFSGSVAPILISANLTFSLNTETSSAKVLDYELQAPSGTAIVAAKAYSQAGVIR